MNQILIDIAEASAITGKFSHNLDAAMRAYELDQNPDTNMAVQRAKDAFHDAHVALDKVMARADYAIGTNSIDHKICRLQAELDQAKHALTEQENLYRVRLRDINEQRDLLDKIEAKVIKATTPPFVKIGEAGFLARSILKLFKDFRSENF